MSQKTDELFEQTTAKMLKLLDSADGEGWEKPWRAMFGNGTFPTNVTTKKAYQGFNVLVFWMAAEDNGYQTNEWATYKQWKKVDAQVRKGEKGTAGIKWGFTFTCGTTGKKGSYHCKIQGCQDSKFVWGSTFTVFNADQVDGYDPEVAEKPESVVDRDARTDAFIAGTEADFAYRGDRAYYTPGTNNIVLPPVEDFTSTDGFYATALHELTHWSGDKSRLDRDQQNIFGSQAYAAEELVAEFGSAFLQAHLGLRAEPSMNAASYLKNWATVLRADEKNLYRAAKYATAAAKFMIELNEKAEVPA